MKANLTATVRVVQVEAEKPPATFDGGVWHCDGRLVTRKTARGAFDEALFWLAIHEAEQDKQIAERRQSFGD